ncbi:helix-turn-helix domain-containing protein [Staphylococcus petrasii]|uniref:spr1629 family repressor/antitoxin n=1 Tax=Staphylococcus petrasii TaxID=1276936 RepID=UPI000CD08FC8|nr:XRE family transcriptional regulator [Staphylococcus petrasii]PNZ84812.1 zinc peptidase [Staphylococcus petrasii]TGA81338.1 ImmA/IrrE family metallo-endopeptidase [Staphylococcus petrasii]SUM58804.1 transcriptional regulator [Staphylococcus petrasii]
MFIGRNLESIRILKGMSRKELSKELNISEQAIWQYETKNMVPEINKIYELANLFQVTTAYFIENQPKEFSNTRLNKTSIAFRAINYKASTKILEKQFWQANYLTNLTNYFFKFVQSPPVSILKIVKKIEDEFESYQKRSEFIKAAASFARKQLMNDKDNRYLLFNLEKSGVIVYDKKIDRDADAFSFWSIDDTPFIILGNNKGIAVRRNFDIGHELGHILLHRHIEFSNLEPEDYKNIEKEANEFAGEFLLPEKEFIEDFNKITKKSNPDYLITLKEKWLVSIQTIAIRAYKLGLLTRSQYNYLWANLNKKGYKYEEPLDKELIISKPVKMNSLLDFLFKKEMLTPHFLLEDLKVNSEFLYEIAGIDSRIFDKYMENEKEKQNGELINLFKNNYY